MNMIQFKITINNVKVILNTLRVEHGNKRFFMPVGLFT